MFEPALAPRDFDIVEIPFPERGDPQLIPNGARERREASEDTTFSAEEGDGSGDEGVNDR